MLLDAVEKMSKIIKVNDPRDPVKVKFPLVPTLFAIILAWIGGCTSAVAVARFWWEHFEDLKKSIPDFPDECISHDTVNRLLSLILVDDLKGLMSHFCQLVLDNASSGETSIKRVLSLDGQTPRATEYEVREGHLGVPDDDRRLLNHLYYVTLYDSTSGLALAMDEVENKENENKACLRAIKMFDLTGTVVTADALNTQRSVAKAIIAQGGDYVLALKDNHKSMRKAVSDAFADASLIEKCGDTYSTGVELGHGRIEERTVIALSVDNLPNKRPFKDWLVDCHTIFYTETKSTFKKNGVERKPERRFFVSSISGDHPNIAELGYRAIRDHWKIENQVHWCLDMDFGQDHMQTKNRNYLRNCELLSRLALNVARQLQPAMWIKNPKEKPSIASVVDSIKMKPHKHLLKVANLFAYGKL